MDSTRQEGLRSMQRRRVLLKRPDGLVVIVDVIRGGWGGWDVKKGGKREMASRGGRKRSKRLSSSAKITPKNPFLSYGENTEKRHRTPKKHATPHRERT